MNPIVKILLRRSLMVLSAIVVWAKALARGGPTGRPGQCRKPIKRQRRVDSKSPTANSNGGRSIGRALKAHNCLPVSKINP
jgi:hypothetical protein